MSVIASLATGLQAGVSAIAPGLTTTDNPLADFSDTPWWLSLVKALFVFLMINTLLVIWFERRIIGRRQQRPGPNRTGPFGLLQSLADGVKLALKEDLTPKNADKMVFMLAPIIAGAMAFVSFAIIPMGSMVSMFGHRTPLQLTDTPVAVLLVLAVAGVGVYGIVLAGWSSGSTYPLLGGLRATAQVISYEIAMGLRPEEINPFAGGSVPPLPGQRLREPSLREPGLREPGLGDPGLGDPSLGDPSLQVDQSSAGSAGDPELTEQEATGG